MKWREAESTQYCNKNTLGVPMFTTLLLSALVSTANISQNETYNVISHQDYRAETSSQNAVWRIFTDRKRVFHDGVRIQPVISSDDAIHRAFCENSLGMTPHQFRTYWLKKRFTSPARLPLQSPSDSVTRKEFETVAIGSASSPRALRIIGCDISTGQCDYALSSEALKTYAMHAPRARSPSALPGHRTN